MKEMVNHPEHYRDASGKECIECMEEKWGPMCVLIFCVLNAYKYKFRRGKKDGNPEIQDLKKANWYIGYAWGIYFNELGWLRKRVAKKIMSEIL